MANTDIEQMCDEVDAQSQARQGSPASHPEFDRLVRTIWRLRQPDGCPWDKEQTHESIRKNMIEEAYEAAEAIDERQADHLIEELGDVMMQVLLHAQIAADEGKFSIDDICRGINEKLVRRHPHVFGEHHARDAGEALASWDSVKQLEREASSQADKRAGLLDSVPRSLPALMQCQKLSVRAAKAGFEWDSVDDVWQAVEREREEFLAEASGSPEQTMEFGDLLFALVNVARWEGIDAEEALAASNAKFRRRWAAVESKAAREGHAVEELSVERQNELWDEVKREEQTP
ncbi:MAG: nucleoside triphosphate pyrophosphohydrolase [Atopobiaceae bacterium]|nr:nucleoside triphosphate pyrophosphohydrolase [Atopobiaceae bacterium]